MRENFNLHYISLECVVLSSLYNKYSSELFIEWLRYYARDCCTNLYSAFTKVKILAFIV